MATGVRTVLLAGLAAAALAAAPAHARDVVAPGLVSERLVRPGPVIAHVVRLDRYPVRRAGVDGPLYRVEAVAAGPLASGRAPLSSIVRSRAAEGAIAGINGDYFSWSGVPTGLLLTGAGLVRDPAAFRSSAVFDQAGTLHVTRLALDGSAVMLGPTGAPVGMRVGVNAVNRLQREGGGETILYTPQFGSRTPPAPGTPSLVLAPVDPTVPLIGPVDARVIATGGQGGISLDGRLVLALGGSRAATLATTARPGDLIHLDLTVPGMPASPATGVGGGPLLVVEGRPWVAPEGFAQAQVTSRTARSAVGQTADGSVLLVSVEDGRSGPSRGVTSAELARLMADLGARTAMGLDSGGSAGISLRGERPETVGPAGERSIATALVVSYRGVQVPAPSPSRVSPNGDRSAETTTAVYRVVGRSAVRAELLDARGRRVARLAAGWRDAGAHRVRVPVRELRDGRYRVRVVARGAGDRRATRVTRTVMVDRTLGHLRLAGRAGGAAVAFRLTRPATVTVRVRVGGGWRTVASGRRLAPGRRGLRVDAPPGRRTVEVIARSRLGTSTLTGAVVVRRR
jgi:hypothetical protein